MASKCPNCGAHLSLVLAGPSDTSAPVLGKKATPTPAQPKAARPPDGAKPPAQFIPESTEADIQRLKEIMCAPLTTPWNPKEQTLRPVVSNKPDVFGALTDRRSLMTLDKTARRMQGGIRREGQRSADTLLEARRRGRAELQLPGRMDLVFEALGAIIYDIEWTADPAEARQILMRLPVPRGPSYTVCLPDARAGWETRAAWETCEYVFELMLCIDYGLPGYPLRGMRGLPKSWFIRDLRQLNILARVLTGAAWYWGKGQGVPSSKAWDSILRVVGNCDKARVGVSVWDIATMLYYYNTRSKSASAKDQEQGWTGYTGVFAGDDLRGAYQGSSPPGAQAVA